MVKGVEIFRVHFRNYADRYVLIGGAACDIAMTGAGLEFRATKDLDIVLYVDALDAAFVQAFWEFVRAGGYEVQETSTGKRQFYRFQKPANADYPFMLELFSRQPDVLQVAEGRIHRFLIHHSLAKLQFAPQGVLFPVSAAMLRTSKAYDAVLNAFSRNTMPLIKYEMDDQQRLTVLSSTDKLYRYYDATPQAEYLYEAVAETIRKDLREEIEFLEVFDKAMAAVKMIVDMPNARASLLARFILQNHGTLSANKRRQFSELRDEEIAKIEGAIRRTNAAIAEEEEPVSEFDEFLSSREAKQDQFRSAEEVVALGTAVEWQNLKDATKALTAGKAVDENSFQWAPYSAPYQDFLQLKNVAAVFIDRGMRNRIPQACSIRFDRNASGPQGVFLEDKSPVPAEVWSLEPRADGQNVLWNVKELGKNLTSTELASQVAIRLVRQFEAYEAAFGR